MGYQTQPDGTQQWSCEGGDPMYSMSWGRSRPNYWGDWTPYHDAHDVCQHCVEEQERELKWQERKDLVCGMLGCIVGIPVFLVGLMLLFVAPWASVITFAVIALLVGGFQNSREKGCP